MIFNKYNAYSWFYFLATCLLLGGIISVNLGQDANWDLKNYHLYNAFAYLNNRLHTDLFAAGTQSYFAPFLDIPYYLLSTKYFLNYPRLLAFIVGLPYGLLIFITFTLAWVITYDYSSTKLTRFLLSVVTTLFGVTGVATISQIGTTFNEIQIAVLILTALLFIISAIRNANSVLKPKTFYLYLVLSGILFGIAAGLKLTACIYAPGAAIVVAAINGNYQQRFYRMSIFSLMWCLGYLFLWGNWGFDLFKMTGNPFFPLFNSIFNSSWIPSFAGLDTRFLPKNMLEALFYPFYWINNPKMTVMEVRFADPRFAVAFLVLVCIAIVFFLNTFNVFKKTTVSTKKFGPIDGILLFFVISFTIWEMLFSILRYAVTLESILGIIIYSFFIKFTSFSKFTFKPSLILYSITILLFFVSLLTSYPNWGRASYSDKVFEISHPTIQDNTLFLLIGKPIAFLIPFLSQDLNNARFIGMTDDVLRSSNFKLGKNVQHIISEWKGPILYIARKDTLSTANLLSNYNLFPAGDCTIIESNIDDSNYICLATKTPNTLTWQDVNVINNSRSKVSFVDLNEKIDFTTGSSGQSYLENGWSSPESWGTWTDADTASLFLHLSNTPSNKLTIQYNSHGFIVPAHPSMTVTISVNGQPLQTTVYKYPEDSADSIRSFSIPADLLVKSQGLLQIEFTIKTPISPESVGISTDERTLGLGMVWLQVTSTPAQ